MAAISRKDIANGFHCGHTRRSGVGGWIIQRQLQNQTVGAAYVNLAVTILENPDKSKFRANSESGPWIYSTTTHPRSSMRKQWRA